MGPVSVGHLMESPDTGSVLIVCRFLLERGWGTGYFGNLAPLAARLVVSAKGEDKALGAVDVVSGASALARQGQRV